LKTEEEEELFYKDKVEDIKYKPKFDKYFFLILGTVSFLVFISFSLLLGIDFIKNLLGSLSFGTIVSFIISLLRQTLIFHRVSITTNKLFAPEKFEDRFKTTLKEAIKGNGKKGIKKFIIAIDNIDRCHKDQAFEILLTIKNFLETEDVIFIIPVDDRGLKKYLQMNDKDANEFLRKLFNTTIDLKSFSDMELYDFGMKLIKEYNISLPRKENVISIVCQEFSKNPRRIIQFLNTLQTEYHLAMVQEEKGFIPPKAITNNIEMLVKILIIREEYPEIFEKINDNKGFLKDIHDAIRTGILFKTNDGLWEITDNKSELINEFIKPKKSGDIKLTEEQYRFFKRTSNIELDSKDLEPFFLNKDIFIDVTDEIYQWVISQDWDSLKEALENKEIEFETLLNFIDKRTDEDIHKRELYDTAGFNLASLIFKIVVDKKYGSQIRQLPQKINSMLDKDEIYKHTYKFPPKELAMAMKLLREKKIETPINNTIERLNKLTIDNVRKDKNPIQLLKEFINVFKEEPIILAKIKDKFSELLKKDFTLYSDFKEIINSDTIKHLLNEEFAKSLIQTLVQDYNREQTKEKVEIIRSLIEYGTLNKKTINQYLTQTIQFIGQLQQYRNWDLFNFWLEALTGLLKRTRAQDVNNSLYTILSNNSNYVIQQFKNSQLGDQNIKVYKAYIDILGEFYLVVEDEIKRHIVHWLNGFFNHQISRDIFLYVNHIYLKIISEIDKWLFAEDVINTMINLNDIELKRKLSRTVNLMMIKSSESKGLNKEQVLKVIKHYFDLLFQEIDVSSLIQEVCENNFIANNVIDYIVKIDDLLQIEKTIEIIKVLSDKFGFDKFYPKIKELIAHVDNHKQEIGALILYEIKDKIPNDKISTIISLLNDIRKLSGDFGFGVKRLDELKEYLSQKIQLKS